MKNLMVSIVCLLILIVPWCMYDKYAGTYINGCSDLIEERIMPAILAGDWDAAQQYYNIMVDKWDKFEMISEYFLDTAAVNEADEMIHKTEYHIITRDTSNAASDASELKHTLTYLHENEMLSPGNIF